MEGHGGDVVGVALEHHDRGGVGGLDIVQADHMAAGGGEVFFVGRDAESVDLGFGVLDRAAADARECFPEADCVVVASCSVLECGDSLAICAWTHLCTI